MISSGKKITFLSTTITNYDNLTNQGNSLNFPTKKIKIKIHTIQNLHHVTTKRIPFSHYHPNSPTTENIFFTLSSKSPYKTRSTFNSHQPTTKRTHFCQTIIPNIKEDEKEPTTI